MAFNNTENQPLTDTGLTAFSQGPSSTDAFRKLFGGIGDALQNTTAAYDASTREDIAIRADKATGGIVKDTSADFDAAGGKGIIEADPDFKTLSAYGKARAQGKLSDIAFNTKVAAKVKEIRARYPEGYGPDVEAAISGALATSAEGKLLDAKLKAADAKLRSAIDKVTDEEKETKQLLNSNMDYWTDTAVLGAYEKLTKRSFAGDLANGTIDNSSLRYVIALKRGKEHEEEMANKRIEWSGKVESADAATVVGKIINQTYNKEMSKPYFAFVEKMTSATDPKGPGGASLTPEESTAVRDGFMQAASSLRLSLATELSQERYKHVPKEQRDAMKNQVEDFIKIYEEALNNPDSGMLNRLANENKDTLVADENYALKNYKEMRIFTLAKKLDLPDEIISKYLFSDPRVSGKLTDNLLSTVSRGGLYSPDEGVVDIIKKLSMGDPDKAKLLKDVFTTYSSLLSTGDAKELDFEKVVSLIFKNKNKDMLKALAKEDRAKVFKMLVNEKTINNIKDDDGALNIMTEWATNQFITIMKPYMDTIKDGDLNRYGMDIQFDPVDLSFKYNARTPTQDEKQFSLFPRVFFEGHLEAGVKDAIQQANDYIRVMKPVWKAQGIDPAEGLNYLFDTENLGGEKNAPLLKLLIDKIKGSMPDTILDYRIDPKTGKLTILGEADPVTPEKVAGYSDARLKEISFSPTVAPDATGVDHSPLEKADIEHADEYLKRVLSSDKPESYISGLDDHFAVNLAKLIDSAPPDIKKGLGVLSGARSVKRQGQLFGDAVKKYGSVAAARKWVAPPGHSMHNHGKAVDLSWNSKRLDQAPGYVIKWLHQNADAYGLNFPLGNENWHIEPKGIRRKKKAPSTSA